MISALPRGTWFHPFRRMVHRAMAGCFLRILQQRLPSRRQLLQPRRDYAAWLDVNALGQGARDDLHTALINARGSLPLISVVMPVYRPKLGHFVEALQSVEQQLYPGWELCLCDDGNDDPALLEQLRQISSGLDKIRIATHAANSGIAAALNSAAAMAQGDVLLFLDQDDVLTPDCLAEFALAFAASPELDLIYSDSDKIDAAGQRTAPSFKPGWSPWLLVSHMYLSHAVAVRRALFRAIDGFSAGFDGSQDYEFALRATEQARMVQHIPRILYHWRAEAGSTAVAASEKPGSIAAGQAALAAALARRAIPASVARPDWAMKAGIGLFQPRFPLPQSAISLIIFADGRRAPSPAWLDAMDQESSRTCQLILIAERPVSSEWPSLDDRLRNALWIAPTGDLAHDLRAALQQATGDINLCVYDRIRPTSPDWLAQLSGYAKAGQALVGARVLRSDGRLVAAGLVKPQGASTPELAFAGWNRTWHGPIYQARTTHEVYAVTGECMAFDRLVRHWLTKGSGTADNPAALGQLLSEQLRAAGGSVLLCGDVEVQSVASVAGTLGGTRACDPLYNPNLGSGRQQFRPTVRSPQVRQSDPVRVVVVTHNLDLEGAQSTLLDLVEGLVQTGCIRATLVSSRPGPLGGRLEQLGIPLELLPSPGRKAAPAEISRYCAALADIYRQSDAQTVLANTLESHLAVTAAADAGLAALWWQHEGGVWWRYFTRWPLWRQAVAFSGFGAAYRVVQVAEATRRAWLPIATRDNFEVVRHGIPAKRMAADRARWTAASARAELGIDDLHICVVLLGSVSRRKAQGDVIRALAQLSQTDLNGLTVFIVGALVDPAYHAELRKLLADCPMPLRAAVNVTGSVQDAALYLAAADVFLCCSLQESAPRAIMEAMAFELPILTTSVDGIPELVRDGIDGLHYAPGDVHGLSRVIQMLLHDRSLRHHLGASAKDRARKINNYDAMVSRFDTLLREAAWQRRAVGAGGGIDS